MAVTALPSIDAPRRVCVLGSTGSIGCNTLELIASRPDSYDVVALTAQTNVELLAKQARQFRPRVAAIGDAARYSELKDALNGSGITCLAGAEGLVEAATQPAEWTMAAIVGVAGLAPALAAVRHGACIALAGKECLVSAGDLFLKEAADSGATLLPVDSEHNAIFQILDAASLENVERIVLTASGGPFYKSDPDSLHHVTPAQATAHPNWRMGEKVSVDSATLMNKGLELIEAHWLFPVGADRLDVLIHPQSVVHGLVFHVDGSVLAHMGMPDMKTPIAHTLAWPERMPVAAQRLDLTQFAALTFEPADPLRFPALAMARECLQIGGGSPTILNAANEVAVQSFLDGGVGFPGIVRTVAAVLEQMSGSGNAIRTPGSLGEVLELDREARACAARAIAGAKH